MIEALAYGIALMGEDISTSVVRGCEKKLKEEMQKKIKRVNATNK